MPSSSWNANCEIDHGQPVTLSLKDVRGYWPSAFHGTITAVHRASGTTAEFAVSTDYGLTLRVYTDMTPPEVEITDSPDGTYIGAIGSLKSVIPR